MSITATGLFDMRAAIPHGDRPRIVWVMDWPTLEEIRSLPEAGVHPGGRDGPVFGWPPKLFGDTVRVDPEAHGVRIELAEPPAPDLVDYLRDKLALVDAGCTCPTPEFLETLPLGVKVITNCVVHGWQDRYTGGSIWVRTEPSRKHWWRR